MLNYVTVCCIIASMLPLLIKDHLVTAFLALIIIFYLVADLGLTETDSENSVNFSTSKNGSGEICDYTPTMQLHSDKTFSLMVCNM